MNEFNKVDIHDYKVINHLKNGAYGEVFLVQNIKTKKLLAAKVIEVDFGELNMTDIQREIEIMSNLHHPTLIKFKGYCLQNFEGKKAATIFMEYIKNGALSKFCYEKNRIKTENYDSTARQIILAGVAYGMKLFHQEGGIHRDLKPDNILLDNNLHPVITDFGCAKIFEKQIIIKQTEGRGSALYMAPEATTNNYDNSVDVYSFGIIMFEIVTESFCYPNNKLPFLSFLAEVNEKNLRPKFLPEKPVKPALKRLIKCCWSKDPTHRPSFEEIFNCLVYNDDTGIEFDEEEEKVDDDDENRYYLDGVDTSKLFEYVNYITNIDEEEEEEEEDLSDLEERNIPDQTDLVKKDPIKNDKKVKKGDDKQKDKPKKDAQDSPKPKKAVDSKDPIKEAHKKDDENQVKKPNHKKKGIKRERSKSAEPTPITIEKKEKPDKADKKPKKPAQEQSKDVKPKKPKPEQSKDAKPKKPTPEPPKDVKPKNDSQLVQGKKQRPKSRPSSIGPKNQKAKPKLDTNKNKNIIALSTSSNDSAATNDDDDSDEPIFTPRGNQNREHRRSKGQRSKGRNRHGSGSRSPRTRQHRGSDRYKPSDQSHGKNSRNATGRQQNQSRNGAHRNNRSRSRQGGQHGSNRPVRPSTPSNQANEVKPTQIQNLNNGNCLIQ